MLLRNRRWILTLVVPSLVLALGCAGTRQEGAPAGEAGVEEVLGVEGEQQPKSEDEVLKLLGITGQEDTAKATSREVVEKTELEQLREKVAELEKKLREKENQIASLKSDLAAKERLISELRSQARPGATSVAAAGEPHPPSPEFRVRYQDALAEYKARNYKVALQLFQELLQTDPNNTLSDNCQYWIGECYYGMGDYNQALVAFEKVFTFPHTNKAPDAQLKIGLCYLKLGDRERARQEFQRLIDNYPDSEYVAVARRYLSQL